MYKFTILYYYESFYNGAYNTTYKDKTRTAVVYAKNTKQAIEKIKKIDGCFIKIADNGLFAEELQSISDSE